jgi:hypothetical protein
MFLSQSYTVFGANFCGMIHSSGSRSDTHAWNVRAVLSNAKEETVTERRLDQNPFHFHLPSQFQLRQSVIAMAFLMLRMTIFRAQREAGDTFGIYTFCNTATDEVSFTLSLRSGKNNISADPSPSISPSVT